MRINICNSHSIAQKKKLNFPLILVEANMQNTEKVTFIV